MQGIMGDAQITVRVDSSVKEDAQRLVDEGKFHNLTDFIQKAMREKIERERLDEKTRFKLILLDLIRTDREVQDAIEDNCGAPSFM